MGVSLEFLKPSLPFLPKSVMQPRNVENVSSGHCIDSMEAGRESTRRELHNASRQLSSAPIRKEKTKRQKTTYNIAHPPPSGGTRSKISLRPKVLLQLQKVEPNSRSVPAYEVLSAAAFAHKAGRTITSLCPGKSHIGPEDLFVLQSQDYSNSNADPAELKKWSSRRVIGLISRRKGEGKASVSHTEIFLEDGAVSEVSVMPNGGYEFTTQECHGLKSTTRWVRKQAAKSMEKTPSLNANSSDPRAEDLSFMFTKITPNMRQHPIVGSISRTRLDIYDHYSIPSVSSGDRTPIPRQPKRPSRQSSISSFTALEGIEGSAPIATEESLRNLILLSGIWVAFREGWSYIFRFDEDRETTSCPSSPSRKHLHRRSPSNQTSSTSSESGAPQTLSNESVSKLGVKKKLIRTGSRLLHRSSTCVAPASIGPTKHSDTTPTPRRSMSAGAAFFKKVNRPNGDKAAPILNLELQNSLHPSTVGLGINKTEEIITPAIYRATPHSTPGQDDAPSVACDMHAKRQQEDSEDLQYSYREEDAKRVSSVAEEIGEVDNSIPKSEEVPVQQESSSAENILYRSLKDMVVAIKKSSGLA